MKKASYLILLVATAVFVLLIASSGASGRSTNLCGQCHGGLYTQYLDILEGDGANQIPSAVGVGETKTVTIVIENSGNPGGYSTLSSVSATLSSRNGHFSVNSPTYNIGDLPLGTKTATWQITGVSDGYDWLLITAQGENPHFSIPFQDNYSPSPLLTVGSPTGTPPPIPTPTPTPTPGPTSAATPTPAPTLTPVPSPTPSPNPNSSSTPEPTNQLSIVLTSPGDGERWAAGTVHSINWNSQGGTSPLIVTLEYSASGANGPWIVIAAGISSNGSFMWNVPNATRVYVRAVVIDSANPAQSASATGSVEVAGTDSEFPFIVIPAILLPAIALLAVVFKRRSTKHVSGKLEKTVVNSHVEIVSGVLGRFWVSVNEQS